MPGTFKWLVVAILVTGAGGPAAAQKSQDARVSDLVQAGKIRIGLFSSQFSKDAASGELRGVRPDMARACGANRRASSSA
jgi:hypothetical protein